ncbi:MAG: Asp/Glu racemase [Rhizobacter sp.]|nr:Asp/Glu racemase [Rhizobacter sp.]
MIDLLIINPNTTASITELLQREVSRTLGMAGDSVQAVTARLGAPYIACEASYAVAAYAALDAWAAWRLAHQHIELGAIIVGCFGDPGSAALREVTDLPVVGLAEAAFIEAAEHGRFAIVTGGSRWAPMLQRLARTLGQADALAGIHTVAPSGAELAADPQAARRQLAQACRDAARLTGADAVILGGAGLAGMAALLQTEVSVPLIDSVEAGARQAAKMAADSTVRQEGFHTAWQGLTAEMMSPRLTRD